MNAIGWFVVFLEAHGEVTGQVVAYDADTHRYTVHWDDGYPDSEVCADSPRLALFEIL